MHTCSAGNTWLTVLAEQDGLMSLSRLNNYVTLQFRWAENVIVQNGFCQTIANLIRLASGAYNDCI